MKDRIRAKLGHYSQRPLTKLVQYDAFTDEKGFDSVVSPGEDGIAYFAGITHELMAKVWNVRALIDPAITAEQAVKALRGIANWIEREGRLFSEKSFSMKGTAGDPDLSWLDEEAESECSGKVLIFPENREEHG